jgi:hypothetical protein
MGTYSYKNVVGAIDGPGGNFQIAQGVGTAPEGISISMEGDKGSMTIGADGEGMHSLHASRAGTVTIRTLKTSKLNALLSAMYNSQSENSADYGTNTMSFDDVVSGDSWTIQEAGFRKFPDTSYATDGGTMEWAFNCIKIHGILGSGQPAT